MSKPEAGQHTQELQLTQLPSIQARAMDQIPFHRSSLAGRELEYVRQAIESGAIAGDETFSRKCEAFLQAELGVPRAMLTPSCTNALELAAVLLDIDDGDEVVVPSFTFVSTANAFVLRGARPVFADIRPDTLNLDECALEPLVTERTKAIVPVHYAGIACAMDAICELAAATHTAVVEDNAHGLFGTYRGRPLGSIGGLAAQSFHQTKNITCGEGGALLINDERYVERAEIIREKGTDRARFFRGEVAEYSWIDVGSSYVVSDLLAAFLYGQLEQWRDIQAQREQIWRRYDTELRDWALAHDIRRPTTTADAVPAWHLYYLLLPESESRDRLIVHLQERGINAVFHFLPLHLSGYARQWGGKPGDCPVAEWASARLLRLPLFVGLDAAEQHRIIGAIMEFAP